MQTAHVVISKALQSSPLPPETIQMVCDEVIRSHNIPALRKGFLGAWKAPLPKINLCDRDLCTSETCGSYSEVGWLCKEHQWAYMHFEPFLDEFVWCRRKSCEGHHDREYYEEDWILTERGQDAEEKGWVRRESKRSTMLKVKTIICQRKNL